MPMWRATIASGTVDIPTKGPTMMHDFSLTEHHVVVYDQPVIFDLDEAMKGVSFPYHWDDDYGSRLGVMPRDGTADDIRWFEVDPCYVFHPMNAYDDGDHVVLDVVRHPRMFDRVRNGPDDGVPTLDRWTIDLDAGKVIEERLGDRPQEFPRVDERVVGRQHRYGYAAHFGIDDQGIHFGGLLKHDLRTGAVDAKTFGPGAHAGEVQKLQAGRRRRLFHHGRHDRQEAREHRQHHARLRASDQQRRRNPRSFPCSIRSRHCALRSRAAVRSAAMAPRRPEGCTSGRRPAVCAFPDRVPRKHRPRRAGLPPSAAPRRC